MEKRTGSAIERAVGKDRWAGKWMKCPCEVHVLGECDVEGKKRSRGENTPGRENGES